MFSNKEVLKIQRNLGKWHTTQMKKTKQLLGPPRHAKLAVIKSVTYYNRKAKKPPKITINSFFPARIRNHACVTQQK